MLGSMPLRRLGWASLLGLTLRIFALQSIAIAPFSRLRRALTVRRRGGVLPLIWLVLFSVSATPAVAAGAEISLGIEPLLSARTLATSFQSFRDFLGDRSASKVVLDTAPNYERFLQQMLTGEFDIAFVGPHSSLLAVQKAGYLPLFKCEGGMQAVLIVDKNSPFQKPQDLKGKMVALPDAHTLGAMLGAEMFRPPQVSSAVDVNFKYNDFSNTAALMLLRGDASAAVVIQAALKIMSPDIQNNVRVLAESKPVPHMMIIVHPRISADKRQKLHDAILEFVRITDAKRNMFVQSCRPSDKLLNEQEVKQLGPYVDELRRRLVP